ncbi:DUF5711 family protein [Solibaculum mannosilyticum]|uniref:DUF5711 family protein n=1 Tax=Solibaculum mannosilyticum TaxID=2780922 RepID=UPI0007A884A1|nr:hypothetical protein BN3661_00811 [Eubacteriaceae bacterium CHKCI005]
MPKPQKTTKKSPDGEHKTVAFKRKSTPMRKMVKAAVWTVVILLLVTGGLWAYSNRDNLTPDRISEWFDTHFASYGTGDGFPVDAAGSTVKQLASMGGDVAFLTDSSFELLNQTASSIVNRQHNCTTPALRVSDTRALIYDRGGSNWRVENRRRTLVDKEEEYKIIAADISENDQIVMVTQSGNGYLSEMRVYDQNFEEKQFNWSSAEGQVVDVAARPDGKGAAAVSLTVEGGQMNSLVDVLDFSSGKATPQKLEGVLLLTVEYSGGRILAVGDTQCVSLAQDGSDLKTYSYDGKYLAGYSISPNGGVALALSDHEDLRDSTLVLLDGSLQEESHQNHVGRVRALSYDENVAMLTNSSVTVIRPLDGQILGRQSTSSGAQDILLQGNTLYVQDADHLNQIDVNQMGQ